MKLPPTIVALAALSMASHGQAGIMWCSAQIGEIGVMTSNGSVTVQYGDLGFIYLCNTVSNFPTSAGTITPEVCKILLSQTLTAKATGKPIFIAVDYGASPAPACTTGVLGSWVVPNPFPYYWAIQQ